MTQFKDFSTRIHARYTQLAKHELFVIENKDQLWELYLASFPEGTDPIYIKNTQHTCNCCRNFIKHLGGVVAVINGKIQSLWDVDDLEYPYNVVAEKLNEFVLAQPVAGVFRSKERIYGAACTYTGGVPWNHFHGKITDRHYSASPARDRGAQNAKIQTLRRGLDELTLDAAEQVLDLIQSNNLYRGEEHLGGVKAFYKLKKQYQALPEAGRVAFVLANLDSRVADFRNSVIGTLVTDISDGVELEKAVRSFESKVAPANYQRTSAIISPAMVKSAMATIEEEGLEPSIHRRLAKISDVNVNDVLWVNNETRAKMQGGIADLLMTVAKASKAPSATAAVDIGIDDFMRDVLPKAKAMAMLVKNRHQCNLVALTAPQHSDALPLFKWSNPFAWSYNGNLTDAIKERVKLAGGNVTGEACFRLAWEYDDDLDLHLRVPTGEHICYSHRKSVCGGQLDVDANGSDGIREHPVENIFYQTVNKMKHGTYLLSVNNFWRRGTGRDFTVQIDILGEVTELTYTGVIKNKETIDVARIHYSAKGFEVESLLPHSQRSISTNVWGITTEDFCTVQTVMHSPNYWGDNAVGNRHYIFVLENCRADIPLRGIYNEFLRSDLHKHRKVFEVLGDKTKCQPTDEHIAGLGFSSTKRDEVIVRVDGRLYNVKF